MQNPRRYEVSEVDGYIIRQVTPTHLAGFLQLSACPMKPAVVDGVREGIARRNIQADKLRQVLRNGSA